LPVRPPDSHSTSRRSPDSSLVRVLRAGDQRAAEELYARYAGRIRSLVASRLRGPVAARLSPEDIVQSVFRTFFEGVIERAYAAPEGRELWGLLCVLALNKLRERVAYHQAACRDVRRTAGGVDAVPDSDAETRWLGVEVDDLLARFRPADREVIHLRMLGYEVTEIADRTGRSLRTIERVLQKARSRLTAELA
jgi:RNA polymerase sigma-70 factor, ECF subfamily